MTLISLKPITITFTETCKISVEDYLEWCDDHYMKIVRRCDVGHGVLSWYKHRGATDDFRNGYFERGTLRYAQELLGDVEPDYSDWDNVSLDW
jgi:hypothetical protein